MRVRSGTLFSMLAIALLLIASNSLFAANWYVATTAHGNGTGSSWANAKGSINSMVNDASVLSGDIINIAGGTYYEQVVIGNKSITLKGSADDTTTIAVEGRTVITSPASGSMNTYTYTVALAWNGAGKLSSNTIKPIVYVNSTSTTISVNIKSIDIDGNGNYVPSDGESTIYAGLVYRYAGGTVGGSTDDSVHITNIKASSWNTSNNNAIAAMVLTSSSVAFSHVAIEDYRNAAIAVIGESTSGLSSVIASQPNPVIQDCRLEGNNDGSGVSGADVIQAGILVANGGRATIRRNLIWQNRSTTGDDGTGRFAYGIYLYDARKCVIGDLTSNKSNGNLITDNEIALYVRMTASTLSTSDYVIRMNNIVYNGNNTPSGKIANYSSTNAAFTSYGYVRFSHTPSSNATLTVSHNAWGNGEASTFYSYSTSPYNSGAYAVTRVAYWRETSGDIITYANSLSPLSGDTVLVNTNNGPMYAGSPATVNGIGVNLGFGFYNVDQMHKAVYAVTGPTTWTPNVLLQTDVTEDESVVATKKVRVYSNKGSNTCATLPSVKLGSGVVGPTIWVYGASGNNDAISRFPEGVTFDSIRIVGNDVQNGGSWTTGPAMLVTGSTLGLNSPRGTTLNACSIDSLRFDGTPYVFSTSQDGTTARTMRYAAYIAGVTDVYALYTSYMGACEQYVIDPEVLDYRDHAALALIHLDQVVNVSNCGELQTAINNASGIRTTIRAINDILAPCHVYANNTSPITFDVIATKTLDISSISINPGSVSEWFGPGTGLTQGWYGNGGLSAVCDIKRDEYLAGNMNVRRVNVFPPACLQSAINLLDNDPTAVLVAASGNGTNSPATFTQSGDSVNIHTSFDYYGAYYFATMYPVLAWVSANSDNATFDGRFTLRGGADPDDIAGSITSIRGASFGDGSDFNTDDNQVELNFTSAGLPNSGRSAIGMALQFVGSTGNKRLELTDEQTNHSGETPTIWKQAFIYGQDNRGTSVGTISLNGSGNCPVGGPDNGSVLRNLNVSLVNIYSANDCIQAALGRVIDCETSLQHIEGVGTSSADGSGGTVNLDPLAASYNFNQNLEVAKSVTLDETASATLGTNGTLTLRRGADISGWASYFADHILMTQCYPYHNGANPSMTQAMNLAGTGVGVTITLAGYGNSYGVGSGSDPRGVWQFQNINVNKDVDIRGYYHSTSATDLSNCANVSSASRPSISSNRNASLETVIGTHNSSTYGFGGGSIFEIQAGNTGASVSGFKFHNVVHGGAGATTIVRLNNNTGDLAFNNNIITGTSGTNYIAGMMNTFGSINHNTININGNHLVMDAASFYHIITIDRLGNSYGNSNITENVIDVSNSNINWGMVFSNVNNSSSTGLTISRNWITGAGDGIGLSNDVPAGPNSLNGITINQNNLHHNFRGVEISNVSNVDLGSNNITIKDNYINNNDRGVELNWGWTNVTVNRLFVNNNNLANNTNAGIYVEAVTDPNGPTTNMFDLRFNYWGSDLGPVRGANVAQYPLLAPSDSARIIGHIPFNHNTGSSLVQHASQPYGRWMVYPVAVTATDGVSGTCGWQYQTMQGAVLRVNAAGNSLLGTYDRITWARDNSNPQAYPAVTGTRTGTDQIFVIAQSTYGANVFGYNGAVESEGNGVYPIVFSADPQPSVIRGINRPTIYTDETGSISVTAAFPRGFTAKDFINHVSAGSNSYTGISFANAYGNTVDYNYFTSIAATPTAFTGITCSNSTPNLAQTFTNNRINLGQNPRWPGGPAVAVSAPSTFTGIEVPTHGGNGSVNISNNVLSVPSTAPKSVGIYVNAQNNIVNSVTVNGNQLRKMAAAVANAGRTSYWGTGIYIAGGNNIQVNTNDIQGTSGGSGHDGITLDKPGTASVNSNTISTILSSNLSGLNTSSTRERGYGIKVFSASGSDAIGTVTINGNTIGSVDAVAPDVASIYVGGTSSTIASAASPVNISGNTIENARNTNNAAIQIATSQYSGASSAGYVSIASNTIGSTTSGRSNAMFLAVGTDGIGTTRNANADNISVNVSGNSIRTSKQEVIAGATREVADGRPNAGMNIRNIFGYGTGSATNGTNTPGNGLSGNNTFTHATILTGEAGLADYATALPRTAKAVALSTPATTPVTIERLIATPLAAAQNADSANTVELRENAGWVISSEDLYYKETLSFPDRRILINGPRTGATYAELLPGAGGTGTMFTSTGRENKDIRGAVRVNSINTGMFGRVSVGAANKGDVYLQLDNVGVDNTPVKFRYHAAAIGSLANVTGLSNGLVRATDIKAGMDDADDDNYVANASTSRRTGVFRSGTAASQFLKGNNNEGITGVTPLTVFPNPANGNVTVSFSIPFEGMVRVALYNALGEKVTDLREGNLSADSYTTSFDAANLPSGTYHVRLVHDLYTITTPVSVIK